MRSYAAARGYFNFIGFLNWCVIIVGVLICFAGLAVTSSLTQALFAAGPGFVIALVGLYGLILVQIGRAGVDSAEYGQQSLQISREQFQLTKQYYAASLAKSGSPGYGDLPDAPLQDVSFDTASSGFADGAADKSDAAHAGQQSENAKVSKDQIREAEKPLEVLAVTMHNGQKIEHLASGFQIGSVHFPTLALAKQATTQPLFQRVFDAD